MAGLFRKLFRIGVPPSDMRAQVVSGARVSTRTMAFDVPPKFVYSVTGIPRG